MQGQLPHYFLENRKARFVFAKGAISKGGVLPGKLFTAYYFDTGSFFRPRLYEKSCSGEGGSFGGYPSSPGGEPTFHIFHYKTWRTVDMRNKKVAPKEGLPS